MVKAAIAIKDTGYPMIYHDELNPNVVGFWHPPMFILWLAASFATFGVCETTARLVPLIFSVLILMLVFLACKSMFHAKGEPVGLLACFLLAINPFFVQNSVQVDLDGSVLTFFLSLWMFMTYRALYSRRRGDILFASIALSLSLMTKLETTFLGVVAVVVFTIMMKRMKKWLLSLLMITWTGSILFAGAFLLYNLLFHNPTGFMMPFSFLTNFFTEAAVTRLGAVKAPENFLIEYLIPRSFQTAGIVCSWLTPAAVLLLAYSLLSRLELNFGTEVLSARFQFKSENVLYLLLWCLAILLTYTAMGHVAWGYPRYFGPALPPLFILISLVVCGPLTNGPRLLIFGPMSVGVVTLTLMEYYVASSTHFIQYLLDRAFAFGLLVSISILVLGVCLKLLLEIFDFQRYFESASKRRVRTVLVAILVLLYVSNCTIAIYHDSLATHSVTYEYGISGVKETGLFIKSNTSPQDLILTTDQIAYYAERRYFSLNFILWGEPFGYTTERMAIIYAMISNGTIRFFAEDARNLEARYETEIHYRGLIDFIRSHSQEKFIIGTIEVYRIGGT